MISWGIRKLTLKVRIAIAFSVLLALGIVFSSLLLGGEERRSLSSLLIFQTCFALVLALTGYKVVAIITRPLSSLVTFLDEVNVEDDLPTSIPRFKSDLPEIQRVALSFEQLLTRLRGYRAINVQRLLIEKRRADIIAASITDGLFLLRGQEILYVNRVGEKILGFSADKSVQLGQFQHARGPRAILSAISRSMPVEFTLEDEGRKAYFLMQAYSIANEVIQKAEVTMDKEVDPHPQFDRFQPDTIVLATDVSVVHESQEAKRHFLGTLSHEVKTPVTSLTMATRLLKRNLDQIENPTLRSLVSTCIDDVERLRTLLEDLLNVTRFETITQKMEVQTIDIAKLVRHTVQFFQPEAKERGVELAFKPLGVGGKPIQVPVDATKISWALSNLLTNALRHTPSGGKIDAEVEAGEETVEVRVRDTGPGIERNRQARVFDKFNANYDLRVARSGTTGMGLAIAREIVAAHGGRIWVTSEPGQGAEFCFTLPYKRASGQSIDDVNSGLRTEMESTKGARRGTTSSG